MAAFAIVFIGMALGIAGVACLGALLMLDVMFRPDPALFNDKFARHLTVGPDSLVRNDRSMDRRAQVAV
jgi:hypothetical protein